MRSVYYTVLCFIHVTHQKKVAEIAILKFNP